MWRMIPKQRWSLLILFIFFFVLLTSVTSNNTCDVCNSIIDNNKVKNCSCGFGYIALRGCCMYHWWLSGILIGIGIIFIVIIIILSCLIICKSWKKKKSDSVVPNRIIRADQSISICSIKSAPMFKDASTETENRETGKRHSFIVSSKACDPPLSRTNWAYESDKYLVPDCTKRRNYDQSAFEEIPLHDPSDKRYLENYNADEPKIIFSIKRPVQNYHSKCVEKHF